MMGKNLNSVFNEMLEMNLSINIELIKRYASLSIPGFITFEGKDIDANFINQDNIQSFIQDNYSKFEINIEKFNEHIEEIRSKDKSDDAMLDCLKKTEALCYNPEQTTQVLLCICSTVRKIIFLIKDIIPSEINDNEKALVILIDCALERMLGANDYYAHLIHDSLRPLLQKDIEKELKKYKDKKSLLLISYRQMCVSSMSFLSQLFFVSMFVMYLYQEVDGYFNRPKESKESLDVLLEKVTKMNAMMVSFAPKIDSIDENTQQTNSKFDTMGKKVEQIVEGQEDIKRKIVVQGDKSDRKLNKIEDRVNKRNTADKRKPLTQKECAVLLYKQKLTYLQKKENYIRQVGISAMVVHYPKNEKSVERTIQRWDQYLASEGKKGITPPKGYSRERSREEFDRWAEVLEELAYENWKRKQPIIPKRNTNGIAPTHHDEDEENIEEEIDDQETRGQVDLVDRVAHVTKRN